MADQEVVIVGSDGTEHVFPAGMDPHRAAQVVRNHELKVKSEAPMKEPTTFGEGFHRKLENESVAGGAVGFAEGAPSGVVGAAKAIAHSPIDILNAMVSTGEGAKRLANDPAGTLSEALDSVKNMPGSVYSSIRDTLSKYLDLAKKNPLEFGRAVGNATGGIEAGLVAGQGTRLLPKPLARTVGQGMATVGKKAEWPLWITGAHQLASGNPAGFATLGMPSLLKSTGTGLVHVGGGQTLAEVAAAEKAAARAAKVAATEAKTKAAAEKALSSAPLPSGARELDFGNVQGVPAGQLPAGGMRVGAPAEAGVPVDTSVGWQGPSEGQPAPYRPSAKAAVQAEENAARLERIRKAKAAEGMKTGEPTIREMTAATTPEGDRASMSTTTQQATESGLPPEQQQMLDNLERINAERRARDVPPAGGPGVVATEGVKPPPPVIDPAAQAVRDQTGGMRVGGGTPVATPTTPINEPSEDFLTGGKERRAPTGLVLEPGVNVGEPGIVRQQMLDKSISEADALRNTPADVGSNPRAQVLEAERAAAYKEFMNRRNTAGESPTGAERRTSAEPASPLESVSSKPAASSVKPSRTRIEDIPPSRTDRTPMDKGTPSLSEADMEWLGVPKGTVIKELPEAQVQRLLEGRARRQRLYQEDYFTNKLINQPQG